MRVGEQRSLRKPGVLVAVWGGFVVALGPALNFVSDATQEYPFYDHGWVLALIVAVVLTVACAIVFAPPITRLVARADSRSTRGNLTAASVFAVCVATTHLVAYLLGDSEWLGTAGWLVVYPIGSLAAWTLQARLDGRNSELSQRSDRSPSRTTV